MDAKMIEGMAEILECEASELSLDTVFRDLSNWDSLAYMSVIAMIDAEFEVVIPQAQFRELKTIGAIVEYIKQAQG